MQKEKSVSAEKKLEFCDKAILLKQETEKNFLMLGAMLWKIYADNLWEGRWEDFDHYVREGVRMNEKTAQSLMRIYDRFVLQYNIEPKLIAAAGGWTYVQTIMPVVKDEHSAKEWLHVATESQSREDLRRLVDQAKPGAVDSIECKHENVKKIVLCICDDCKEKWEEHE